LSNAVAKLDAGSINDLADYLASCVPVCPVIVHTTNTEARLAEVFETRQQSTVKRDKKVKPSGCVVN
jgi:hypothetical protein